MSALNGMMVHSAAAHALWRLHTNESWVTCNNVRWWCKAEQVRLVYVLRISHDK